MSFTLSAPYPGVQTTTILPNPQFGNSEGRVQEINLKRSIQGTVRTYVKRGTMPNGKLRSKMQWSFTLTRNKAVELLEFTNSYHSSQIQIFDQAGREYRGFIMNNPLEISPVRRGAPNIQEMPRGELCEVTLEFEGEAYLPPRPPIVWNASARNDLTLYHIPTQVPGYPTSVYGLVHHWDAWDLTSGHSDGDKVPLWNPTTNASSSIALEKHPTGIFPYGPWDRWGAMDYSPIFRRGYIGPGLPSVSFNMITNNQVISTARMRTNGNTRLWSTARVGTVMWVASHTMGNPPGAGMQWFQNGNEIGFWSMRGSSGYRPYESYGYVGGLGDWEPATYRHTGGSGDPYNPRLHNSTNYNRAVLYQRGRPYVNTLIRDGGTIRYRLNGVELDGRTIINYTPVYGRLQFNNTILQLSGNNAVSRGHLGEFLVFHRILSASEIEQVETYLAERWSIPYEYLWEHEDQCFGDWCISYPHFCTNYPGGTRVPNPPGVPGSDWAPANIEKGVAPNYHRTCCEDS